MYIIVDKKTKAILHMSNSFPGEDKQPQDLLPSFDPATMDFGRAAEQCVPVEFAIEDGVVKDLAPAAEAPPAEGIDEVRQRRLREFSEAALASRRALIPDHQLLNAGIGLYEEERIQAIRDTVAGFRDEYLRVEKLALKAKSKKELEAIVPSFPTAIAASAAKSASKQK